MVYELIDDMTVELVEVRFTTIDNGTPSSAISVWREEVIRRSLMTLYRYLDFYLVPIFFKSINCGDFNPVNLSFRAVVTIRLTYLQLSYSPIIIFIFSLDNEFIEIPIFGILKYTQIAF